MKTEIWKPIPSFDGYEASNRGRVRSIDRVVMKRLRWSASPVPHTRKGKILSHSISAKGYVRVPVRRNGKAVMMSAHQLVLLAFKGEKADGMITRHLNGVRSDNRPENLEWGTLSENYKDREKHGTETRGEAHPKATISESDVRYIKSIKEPWPAGTYAAISKRFKISKSTVHNIRRGHTWGHV